MASVGLAEPLQDPVDRFARALTVPRRLLALHPRKRGNAGDAAALAPAITLGVIAAFEGFVEEFVATGAILRRLGVAPVAKAVGNLNNPDVDEFENLVVNQLGVPKSAIGSGFSVEYWQPPPPPTTWWQTADLDWTSAKKDAKAWMQVRHLLTHGLTSGWQAEHWPGPLKANGPSASEVLRRTPTGRHTLVIHGAITCARIYVEASRHLAGLTAQHLGRSINVDILPDFPLYKEQAHEPPAPTRADGSEELADEGEETPPAIEPVAAS
ncbi:hypothetical protein [Actinoplanes sp. NPDC026623]|uniref:hypothetical protein n=1 Tax=Actinoplanes sp. NPDC026623 TaxID=3155610 RepID=UPI0033CE2D93